MGYNSNLSNKQNRSLTRRNKLWTVGIILRSLGLIGVGITLLTGVLSGGWLFLILLVSPLNIPSLLLLAVGQYLVSNWKNK